MRLGTSNVIRLYRTGSLNTVARELVRYRLDVESVQEVGGDKGHSKQVEDYTFVYGEGNENHQIGTGIFLYVT